MSTYKTVNYKVEVPNSNLCINTTGRLTIYCNFFDNTCGYPRCTLGFTGLEKVNEGVQKPKECVELN